MFWRFDKTAGKNEEEKGGPAGKRDRTSYERLSIGV
jgi:hypothetical protein